MIWQDKTGLDPSLAGARARRAEKRVKLALLYHKNGERRATVTSKTHFMPLFSLDNTSYKGPGQIADRIEDDFTEHFIQMYV